MAIDPTAAARVQLEAAGAGSGIAERLKSAAKRGDQGELKKAAQAFEGYFVQTLLKEMRKAADVGDGLFSGPEMEMFSDLFDQEIAGRVAGRGIGLADMIVRSAQRSVAMTAYGAAPPSPSSDLRWPLPDATSSRISSAFGLRDDPLGKGTRQHDGLDISAPEGTPVLAVRGGVVRRAGEAGGYGNLVEIDHGDGLVTRYAHQQELWVHAGQRVEAGEILGTVGSTGRSTGPHLHLEVRLDGEPVDPERFLR